MKEFVNDGNLFCRPSNKEAVLVTTNGIVRRDGNAVMGAGIAKYVRDTFYGVDRILGNLLREQGNHVYYLGVYPLVGLSTGFFKLFSFPTKDDWKNDSKPELIRQSCKEIMQLADEHQLEAIYLPCPGCRNGKLNYWRDVRPILEEELDDRFEVNIPTDIMRKKPKEV